MTSVTDRVDDAPCERLEPGRRHRRVWPYLLVATLAWGAWCAVQLSGARSDALDGVEQLDAARDSLTPEALVRGEGGDRLIAARDQLVAAHDAISSWALLPLRHLPWLGRQISSVSALTAAASEITDAGIDAMAQFHTTLERDQSTPSSRIALTEQVGTVASSVRERVRRIDLGPDHALVGPLDTGRRRFVEIKDRLDAELGDLQSVSTGMTSFLLGPSNYLLFAANNGEMRAGSGMFLSAGVLSVNDGDLAVDDLRSTTGLRLPAGTVDPEGDMATLWGWTAPSVEWRNLAMTPRFDATAELASRMWAAKTGQKVDGVMVVDPVALQALLAATGPIEVDGTEVSAENIIDQLSVDQYRDVVDVEWDEFDVATASRRNRLALIAHAVLDRVQQGGWSAADLLTHLATAARGRHVLAWSSHPEQLAGWRAAGVSGELDGSSLALSLLSQGGTKIDGWMPVTADLTRSGDRYSLEVTLTNTAPEYLPKYVGGPSTHGDPNVGVAEGTYAGIVSLSVPGVATSLSIDGVDRPVTEGRDGPSRVIATRVTIARGASATLEFRFELPAPQALVIEPSARLDPIHWRYQGKDAWDTRAFVIDSNRASR